MVHGDYVVFSEVPWVWYDRRTRTFMCTGCAEWQRHDRPIKYDDIHTFLLVHEGCQPDTPTLRPLPK